MRVFGLTGGIASGKSTVARRFAERGVPIIDADRIARDVVAVGTEGLDAVVKAFGPAILLASGELDRRALGTLVFADRSCRAALNSLLHPRIRASALRAAQGLGAAGHPLACYEAALLFETGLDENLRPLVVVAAPAETQMMRLQARNHLSIAEARARLDAQMPLAEKVRAADLVIQNDSTFAKLIDRADNALDAVLAVVGLLTDRYPHRSSSFLSPNNPIH